ncbi:MAG TPA: tRNA (guanosine(37)-N1)-methyltransferase TrmD [Syntrophorhabdales bacterium]|nr:tRNA (guanosine(37)-N1)-methyltransferase TrmD [Syntrophorhabdales bacterium]
MIFTLLTLFPSIFESPLNESLLRKARDKGLLSFNIVNIRDFADDIHRTCDDAPYGGGAGMVMKAEPIYRAMEHVNRHFGKPRYLLLTPHGRTFTQKTAANLALRPHIGLVCGRYEGIDERVHSLVDDELSIGDYVLSGGEAAALVVIDAVARLVPGVMGNETSAVDESFGEPLLEYPQYTRPQAFMGMEVPAVLLSGNHEEIRRWRRKESIRRTILSRPDLLETFEPSDEDRRLIREIMEELAE